MSKYKHTLASLKWDDINGEGYIVWNKKIWNQWKYVIKADALSDWAADIKKEYQDNDISFHDNPRKALGLED